MIECIFFLLIYLFLVIIIMFLSFHFSKSLGRWSGTEILFNCPHFARKLKPKKIKLKYKKLKIIKIRFWKIINFINNQFSRFWNIFVIVEHSFETSPGSQISKSPFIAALPMNKQLPFIPNSSNLVAASGSTNKSAILFGGPPASNKSQTKPFAKVFHWRLPSAGQILVSWNFW